MRHTKQISRTNFGPADTRRRFDVLDWVAMSVLMGATADIAYHLFVA